MQDVGFAHNEIHLRWMKSLRDEIFSNENMKCLLRKRVFLKFFEGSARGTFFQKSSSRVQSSPIKYPKTLRVLRFVR